MKYNLDRQMQTICINSIRYNSTDFLNQDLPVFAKESEFGNQVYLFLKEWLDDSPNILVRTSGSTGIPKEMCVEKSRMIQSAKLTCDFLDLQTDNTALLCMSVEYIGGKMMIVRALILNLNLFLVTPNGNPLSKTDVDFDFAAMIPMQVYNSLQNENEKKKLAAIKSLIIGGGSIDSILENNLKYFPNKIYSSYGMTETLSHIALRKLNGKSASSHYIAFPSVKLTLSKDQTLVIDAALVSNKTIYTNDIAEINKDGSFKIIGRKDNIVNSGGIKIQIEEIENFLNPLLKTKFAISSLSDNKFGEIIVLAVEKIDEVNENILRKELPLYYFPKKIIELTKIPLTETGKIDRVNLKDIINQLNKQ